MTYPKFLKAMANYRATVQQYGEEHPIAMQAFMLAFELSPQHLKDEAYKMAEQYLPKPSRCLDNGQPVYNLQDIADHHGITFEEAEQRLLQMMDNRQQVGLSNDGILINPNSNFNRVQ